MVSFCDSRKFLLYFIVTCGILCQKSIGQRINSPKSSSSLKDPQNPSGGGAAELMQINTNQDQCNKTVGIYEEIVSPPVTADNYGKPLICHYRFRPFRTTLRDWVLRIRFTKFKVGRLINDSYCENGYLQIIDGAGKTGISFSTEPGKFCGEIEQPQTFISETSSVRLVFSVDNFTEQSYFRLDSRAEQPYEVYQRYGQHPELYPNRRGEIVPNTYCERVFRDCRMQTCFVQSPGYPGLYPRNLKCKYYLNTRLPFTKLHLETEEFNVDGQRCENSLLCPIRTIGTDCPHDYIRVHDGKDESGRVIGTFCGVGKFPHSIIGTGSDMYVEFVSSEAGPLLSTGFHFNVAHWPGHVDGGGRKDGSCEWVFTSVSLAQSGEVQGLFWSVSHWYPPNTLCTYLMSGEKNEVVRLDFPSFRIGKITAPIAQWNGECGESLTIYDSSWADDSKILKTFCSPFSKPLEKTDFVSSSNSLFVRFESRTGSYSGSSLYYWAHYDFFNNTPSGKRVGGSVCDEVFHAWEKQEGFFTSPQNTLVYKSDSRPIVCKYKFITNKRLYGRIILKIDAFNFKYNQDTCANCWTDRVDKVTLIDPHRNRSKICICKENQGSFPYPITLVSQGEDLEATLRIDPRHALSNYFKNPLPIFKGSFEFIHGPLCGLTTLGPSSDGKLKFPFYFNPALKDEKISCLWELNTHADKDLWLHIERLVFSSTVSSCGDAKLEFYLPSPVGQGEKSSGNLGSLSNSPFNTSPVVKRKDELLLKLCGEPNSGEKREISSQLPIISSHKLSQGGPLTIKLTAKTASKVSFVLSWTELVQMPKDGAAKLEGSTGFLCPGPLGLSISNDLVCNGVINCPLEGNGTKLMAPFEAHDESELRCKMSTTRYFVLNVSLNITWVRAAIAGGLGALLFCLLCLVCSKCCRRKTEHDLDT